MSATKEEIKAMIEETLDPWAKAFIATQMGHLARTTAFREESLAAMAAGKVPSAQLLQDIQRKMDEAEEKAYRKAMA